MDTKTAKLETNWKKRLALKEYQVAILLGLSVSTLGKMRRNGTIPHSKVGRSVCYLPGDLIKWLKQNTVKIAPPKN